MSNGMIQHFQQLYTSMDTDELIDLQRKGSLRSEAEEILNQVLETRGITAIQRNDIAAELAATAYEDQLQHVAPIGSRIMARLIDISICFAIAAAVGFVVLHLPAPTYNSALLSLIPIGFFGYFLFADCMPGGQSFGKKWNKIAVVDQKTHVACTGIQSLIRNFLLATVGIIDMALVLGHQGQRIGDRAVGTQVIRSEYLGRPTL